MAKMAETIDVAKTGRARCRVCRQPIEKGTLRFGEEQPSAFAEGMQWGVASSGLSAPEMRRCPSRRDRPHARFAPQLARLTDADLADLERLLAEQESTDPPAS